MEKAVKQKAVKQNNANPVDRESGEVGSPKFIALKFVEVINAGDSEELIKIQTEDFTFIDMAGDITHGRDGWQGYFSAYPNYKIVVQHVLTSGNGVAIIGKTTGSHVSPEVEEKETVLWTAEIRDNLVAEWRIYSDIKEAEKRQKNHINDHNSSNRSMKTCQWQRNSISS